MTESNLENSIKKGKLNFLSESGGARVGNDR